MGCFLACFGSSKNEGKRRKQYRNKVQPRGHQRIVSCTPVQSTVSQDASENPTNNFVSQVSDEPEKELSFRTRKKVTFDSSVKTYESVSCDEAPDFSMEGEGGEKEREEENLAKSNQSKSSSEDSSITSSSVPYPPNHRYQNWRDSDDEYEGLDHEDSDLDDEDDDDDEEEEEEEGLEVNGLVDDDDGIVESRGTISAAHVFTEEVDNSVPICGLRDGEAKPIGSNPYARDRSMYVHPVLNPVENLTQWKAVKAKGTPPLRPLKENLVSNEKPRVSFGSEPGFKELSFSFKSKTDQSKKSMQEIAVDASLSNWLVSSDATPVNKTSITPEKSMSQGSNSWRSQDDRPILGALTVEELKQFSASSSPRKSPSRSPDEMPIIGTVGTYWNHTTKDSGSVSSYKGIPNTTSKYREDKRVNWHSTPFETRLERALNRGGVA